MCLFVKISIKNNQVSKEIGGEGGIRTHDTIARMPVFETGPFNHSGTHPMVLKYTGIMDLGKFQPYPFQFWGKGMV